MGTWRGLRVAFILGSLFMSLLIVVYWDDIGDLTLYPLQDRRNRSRQCQSCPGATPGPPHLTPATDRTRSSGSSFAVPTAAFTAKPLHGETTGTADGQKLEETREDEGRGRSPAPDDGREQEERKQRMRDVCSGKDAAEFPGRTRTFEQIPHKELDHLIVDDTNQIIYCYVPKVACTNWKRVMLVLSQSLISPSSGKPYSDPEDVPPRLVHNSTLYHALPSLMRPGDSQSLHQMAHRLQNYTKFLFVRDPFVRLISAFRNKFDRANENFYKDFGKKIMRRYGHVSGSLPKSVSEAIAAGLKPTFQQFVTYLLDPDTEKKRVFNEHWRQVYRLCHPCQVKYDFIGRLETLDTDADRLLKLLKVDHLLRFPSGPQNRSAVSWEREWFAEIPVTTRRELYKLYEPDFELFGYPEPDVVLHL